MKIKVLVLLTGAFIATSYLVGCGKDNGNNNNNVAATCAQYPAGTAQYQQCISSGGISSAQCQVYPVGTQQYNSCIASTGISSTQCQVYPVGTPQYQQCIQSSGVGYNSCQMYPVGTYQYQQCLNTSQFAGAQGSFYQGSTGWYPSYPMQQPIYYNPGYQRGGYVDFNIGW